MSFKLVPLKNKVVSSAKSTNDNNLLMVDKSLMYNINNNGSNNDPWGVIQK